LLLARIIRQSSEVAANRIGVNQQRGRGYLVNLHGTLFPYLPIQKRLKTRSRISSVYTAPATLPSSARANLSSAATSSSPTRCWLSVRAFFRASAASRRLS